MRSGRVGTDFNFSTVRSAPSTRTFSGSEVTRVTWKPSAGCPSASGCTGSSRAILGSNSSVTSDGTIDATRSPGASFTMLSSKRSTPLGRSVRSTRIGSSARSSKRCKRVHGPRTPTRTSPTGSDTSTRSRGSV